MIDLDLALPHLKRDKKLEAYIRVLERPTFLRRGATAKAPGAFYALAESIVYQQLSGKAALTIFTRFCCLFPKKRPTPRALLALTDMQMRSAGLSSQKISYLRDLAQKFEDKYINEKGLETWSDEEVREHLTAVKGIGRWTADMFLIFYLHRPDVLPTGDLGIRKGFKKLFNMRSLPSPERMEKLALTWRPWRTVASRYLWQIQDEKPLASETGRRSKRA